MGKATGKQLFRAEIRGPIVTKAVSAVNQWAGLTVLASGSATVTVSTTVVNSDSIIQLTPVGNANLSSGAGIRHTEVKTISSGGYFTIGTNDGIGIARDTTIGWVVWKTSAP